MTDTSPTPEPVAASSVNTPTLPELPVKPTIIRNKSLRSKLSYALYALGVLSGIAALFFAYFPEIAHGTDLPSRGVAFINGVISLVSNGFGLAVSAPNVNRSDDAG